MNPIKTIRINEGAIDYVFTIYQQIEAPLPSTRKLESALLTALKVLWGGYQHINFYVLHIPREWRLVFTLSPCSDSRSISTNLSISSTEYLTTGSGELGGIIAAFVRNSVNELLGNQRWKIRRLHNSARPYLIEITKGLEYLRFEADDFRTVSTESDEISFELSPVQIKVQRWIEISAQIERGACQISHNNLMINGLKFDVFILGFYNYAHATSFTIKPNIISGSMQQQGEIITFQTAPIQERANRETDQHVAHERNNRSSREEAIIDYARRMGLITSQGNRPESAINDKVCKYFNGGAYLKCAVNPTGACEGCKEYEPNN